MTTYVVQKPLRKLPRIPLSASIDLTYRCNNHCRHCWLWLSPAAPEKQQEMSFDEIRRLVDDARRLGCREWAISGGEPMLRPDFAEIFDYMTSHCSSYTLNTNGSLITPAIARLLKRKGGKMIALYGATAEVHDHITRRPGSFEATMRGIAYMKEAGAGFIVQIIPMRDSMQQLADMYRLAQTLSPNYRIGAAWLFLSACGRSDVNDEIRRQRVEPRQVIELDKPSIAFEDKMGPESEYAHPQGDDRLFAACINRGGHFHVDPYGTVSWCGFVKVPELRYDLRQGSFQEAWDTFLPSVAGLVRANDEYWQNCGSCELRTDCRWCPVYSFLEHRRFTAKVDYLCAIAAEKRAYAAEWRSNHRRYFQCGGMTVQIDSDLPITEATFDSTLRPFQVEAPGNDIIRISQHFSLPDLSREDLGEEVYHRPPWAIYRKGSTWIYLGISPKDERYDIHQVAIFNRDHNDGRVYCRSERSFKQGNLRTITMLPTDQILFARLLADREGCYIHSSAVVLDSMGLMFVGHSGAGKSTAVRMLSEQAHILCDDRNIIRHMPDGFRIYGTWNHSEIAEVSPASAPLRAILFLIQDSENRLVRITDKRRISPKLLACLVKPFVTADWWEKTLAVMERIVDEVPCYDMHFDLSGQIVDVLRRELA